MIFTKRPPAPLTSPHITQRKPFIFEKTGKVAKTHSGVISEFHRAARDHPDFGATERAFLSIGYGLKTIADYGVGPQAVISRAEATEAVETARHFVAITRDVLSRGDA